ncbi:ankyrin repeat and SOCS box protein 17-like [Scomber scombrus]|uniref:Ankyrin repeat and SOCS box protein 17-like n=1 Tax=Scomber scombrus TaxID=13677 RepID=A0AAV1NID4_SCOSC
MCCILLLCKIQYDFVNNVPLYRDTAATHSELLASEREFRQRDLFTWSRSVILIGGVARASAGSHLYFTLSDTISGLSTVLSVVAKNCHIDALRILLQHGMLEKERRPSYIINVILFTPLPLVEEEYIKATLIRRRIDCMVLCFRVLTRVSITHLQNGCIQFGFHVKLLSFKVQVRSGRMPLTEDWSDHIPHGRCTVPCELSHLCRVAIRRRLLSRALLPKGIFELPLPESLKKYLNLQA